MTMRNILLSLFLIGASCSSNAGIITWNIVTNYQDLNGTITFDDSPIAGLVDGAYDANDTHIYGATFTLSSALLGINYVNNNAYFQPLTNTFDNKHIDSCYSCNIQTINGTMNFSFTANSDQGSPATGVSEYWLSVNGDTSYRWAFSDSANINNPTNLVDVPEPAGLAVLLMAGLFISRTKKKLF